MSGPRRLAPAVLLLACVSLAAGCTSVARITTLSEPECDRAFTAAVANVLQGEGEPPDVAERLARASAGAMRAYDPGPRPFLVESPSGTDYSFFVEKKGSACLLRLYGRQKGFTSYTNNLTYIATEPLAPCRCDESGGAAAAAPAPSPAGPPPSMDAVAVVSGGARMNGLIYVAEGAGPHPVALFLHGFPGNEKNLDLAQAVRRAGWDAVYFDYRGSWGSGGTFSFANALEDVGAWLAWIREPANAAKYRFDPSRIAVVGHSFGGWLALLSARREPPSVCVAAMAAWNLGWLSRHLEDPAAREAAGDATSEFRDATDPAGGPLHTTADALASELASAPADWNYLAGAEALRSRAVLLVAAARDSADTDPEMHARLARAIGDSSGLVKGVTLDDDHAFSGSRERLTELLAGWLNGDCARSQRRER